MNRNEMEAFIKNYIRVYLLRTREECNLSQEKMAELLKMSCRGYVKLEYGESCCNTVTFLLILFGIEEYSEDFIVKMRKEFFRAAEGAVSKPVFV